MEGKVKQETGASWFDKRTFSQHWVQLIDKATYFRSMEANSNYYSAVDSLVITLLKNERREAIKFKDGLIRNIKLGGEDKLHAYDRILSRCIDILEDAGYLTKEIVMTFGDES